MTSLRSHVARIRHEALAGLRSALNIASPSRVFIDAARSAGRRPHAPPVPLPWYSARGPLDPHETPELAAPLDVSVGSFVGTGSRCCLSRTVQSVRAYKRQ
jgi:hypothetical protein